VPAAAAPAEAIHPAPAQPAPSAVQGRKALIIDDDPRIRDAMAKLLARWGVEASFCADGAAAIALLAGADAATRWHVLIDYRLGGAETGFDIAARIREKFGDRANCALITGEADEALDAQAAAQDIVILRKPVEPVRLRALLAR